jgi:pseudouridylate synthase
MQPLFPIDVREHVASELQNGQPVVALGTAALAHSLPWPVNLETVRLAEAAAQEEGATLAILAIWQGKPTVGVAPSEMEQLARGASAFRASRRDLHNACVRGLTAATTVAASMYIAFQSGIRLLAAGAIGGATQGGEHNWDISADLIELSRTPVAVINGGGRSVLNLARTGEILESYGVPVIGYRTDFFHSFYLCSGGHPVSARADTPEEVAVLLAAHWGFHGAGVVVTQPTPEAVALTPDELQPALESVEREAKRERVRDKDLPPFLMSRLNRLVGGKPLKAYQAILVANVRLAAQIARKGNFGNQGSLAGDNGNR